MQGIGLGCDNYAGRITKFKIVYEKIAVCFGGMDLNKIKLGLGALILLLSGQANASQITEGSLIQLSNPLITDTYTTVDKWSFSTLGGPVKIDVLSWEGPIVLGQLGPPFFQSATDENGDGEIAFFDSIISIFKDDGSLDSSDWLLTIDDDMGGAFSLGDPYCNPSTGGGFADGSKFHYDSCMETDLGVGDYILTVASYGVGGVSIIGGEQFVDDEVIAAAVAGVSLNDPTSPFTGTLTCESSCGGLNKPGSDTTSNAYGDYQITWSDNVIISANPDTVVNVPAPPAIWLFGIGLIGLVGFGKRKKAA